MSSQVFRELIQAAGGATVSDIGVFISGIMMGTLTFDLDEVVTKTTGGLIVLPSDHYLITRRTRSIPEMHHIGEIGVRPVQLLHRVLSTISAGL